MILGQYGDFWDRISLYSLLGTANPEPQRFSVLNWRVHQMKGKCEPQWLIQYQPLESSPQLEAQGWNEV